MFTGRINCANCREDALQRIIRPYEPTDLGGVMASWESASAVAHPFLTEAFLDQERYNIPNVYLPNTETWVVEQDGTVVGFAALMGNEVGAIFVHAAFHGTGAGKALMDKAVELHGDVELEVFKDNAVGRAFYDRYGFELMHEKLHEESGHALLRLKYSASGRV
jgi:putative acetyltransferase